MIRMRNRKAIAMIELIFAIVIIGLILMTAPMVISTATKSGYVALQQESIAAASSEIGMILTHHWDEEDTDQNLSAPILRATGDTDLNEVDDALGNPTGLRAGTSIYSKRTFLTSLGGRLDATAVGDLGHDLNDRDDIDDFTTLSSTLYEEESTTTSDGDYIDKDIVLSTTVSYISDAPTSGSYTGTGVSIDFDLDTSAAAPGGTTNIKSVVVNLTTTKTDEEMDKSIVLRAFSCNIGTYELEERTF